MTEALYLTTQIAWYALPAIIFGYSYLREKPWPLWRLIVAVGLFGWGFMLIQQHFYYEHLAELIAATPNPSDELMKAFTADGGKRVFAYFFGWSFSLIYGAPFLLVYRYALANRTRQAEPE